MTGRTLGTLDPGTLERKEFGQMDRSLNFPAWTGKELYGTNGGELVKVTLP
jgi:hypothetical protein